MKTTVLFCIETIIKMLFIIGSFFMFFILPYFILTGGLFHIAWIDLLCIQISMFIGCLLAVILNEIRKDCGRGIGIFFCLSKYKEQ